MSERKDLEKLTLEEALQHISDNNDEHYMGFPNCSVCKYIKEIFSKYKMVFEKVWDYDD